MSDKSDWDEWKRHILAELGRLSSQHESILAGVQKTREDIAGLESKASTWGAVSGAIGGGVLGLLATIASYLLGGK